MYEVDQIFTIFKESFYGFVTCELFQKSNIKIITDHYITSVESNTNGFELTSSDYAIALYNTRFRIEMFDYDTLLFKIGGITLPINIVSKIVSEHCTIIKYELIAEVDYVTIVDVLRFVLHKDLVPCILEYMEANNAYDMDIHICNSVGTELPSTKYKYTVLLYS